MPLRRQMSLRPVKSEKHEVTWSNLGENASTTKTVILIDAKTDPTATGNQIEAQSQIKSIYVETNLNGVDNSGTVQIFHWMIYKNPANLFGVQDPAVYDTSTKRFILKRGMEMLPEIPIGSGGTVQTKRIFVVKIPRHLHRFGENDTLILSYKSTSASGINFCGIAIFKEFK